MPVHGCVAPTSTRAAEILAALPAETMPLALAPASNRGWFGGLELVTWAPSSIQHGLTLREAADGLLGCFAGSEPQLAAALVPYDGSATLALYTGGVVRKDDGWRVWGTLDPTDVPALGGTSELEPEYQASLIEAPESDMTATEFRAAVRSVIDAICAGDVYVLNLTRRITGRPAVSPEAAFAALLSRCHPDMGAFWATPEEIVVSASPERFVRVSGDSATINPIKGTRPRVPGPLDRAMVADLLGSEKERAEHVMIVDLVRNDLGRVCRPGSVTVEPIFEVVTTPYCHQMVSSVTGSLQPPISLGALLESAFPCGSVTGAPKIAAMGVIADLEKSSRAAYTGSLAISIPGEFDSSILIRTAEYSEGCVRWGTGGGITVDSDAADEWLETALKASPFVGDGFPDAALRETCRVVHGRVPLLSRHLARLAAAGCGSSVLSRVREHVMRVTASGGSLSGRLAVAVEPNGDVHVDRSGVPSSLDVPGGPTVSCVESAIPLLPRGAAKPLDRSLWDRAQEEARGLGADQAILCDVRGNLIDGATASVWIRTGRLLLTPPSPPAVDGVARSIVIDNASQCGCSVEQRTIPYRELEAADEVFLCNALHGVAPVRGRSGYASQALGAVFEDIFLRGGSAELQ